MIASGGEGMSKVKRKQSGRERPASQIGRRAWFAAGLLWLPARAHAQPSADQVLTDMGLSAADKQRVLNGEFVTADLAGVSERDLSFAIAFLVNKTTPDAISKQLVAGDLVSADAQVQAHGEISGAGTLADLAGLKITADEARALPSAKAGEALNFSAAEIAALKAAPGSTPEAVQQALRQVLLARYQAYRAAGLAGIPPYDRGGGRTTDVASDLRKASEAAKGLAKYLPAFQKVLLGYPKATAPELRQNFFWVKSVIQGKPTYVLTHILAARRPEQVPADAARVRRVPRVSVPPRRPVGPVLVLLPQGRGLPRQVRSAQCAPHLGDGHGRSHPDAALGQDRQAEDPGRRSPAPAPDGGRQAQHGDGR